MIVYKHIRTDVLFTLEEAEEYIETKIIEGYAPITKTKMQLFDDAFELVYIKKDEESTKKEQLFQKTDL